MTSSRVIRDVRTSTLPTLDHGLGVRLFDTAGRSYLDASSGAAVASIGHSHPYVLAAMAAQAARATYCHRGAFAVEATEELAERVTAATGTAGAWFVGSGSEATEAAIAFALQYFQETGRPQRTRFLTHRLGYHGNTLGSLSLSGHPRRGSREPLLHDFAMLDEPWALRNAPTLTGPEYTAQLLDRARARLTEARNTVAAIVVEPVGGATLAATVPPPGYLAGLRALCDEYDVLLVADEVMTGYGRTGAMLAMDHEDVRADIVALGKGMSAGYTPLAATLLSDRVQDGIRAGSGRIQGGHTYAGNPLSCATACAVLDVVEKEGLVARAAALGEVLGERLAGLAAAHDAVAETRGRGLLRAIELHPDGPVGERMRRFTERARHHGALVYPATAGANDAVLVSPPLTTTDDELAEMVAVLDRALGEV
ncbi:aspartate aminotransferase family protein [Pseudonocardia alni]|uniref:aminotransferase family protein n=1 Tax=Pseudonocardia alni TaxID=33907 RepID=UPI0033EB59A3